MGRSQTIEGRQLMEALTNSITLATVLLRYKVILKYDTTLISKIDGNILEVSLDKLTFLNILNCDSVKERDQARSSLEKEANSYIGTRIFVNKKTFLKDMPEYSLPLVKYRNENRNDILSLIQKMYKFNKD